MKTKVTIIGAIAAFLLIVSASASALLIELEYEFDGLLPVQNYGTVEVTEVDVAINSESIQGLYFEVAYNIDTYPLGPRADIHEFYFNLIPDFAVADLSIITDDVTNTNYALLGPTPPVAGNGGASFDWGVNFGNGSSASGNGILPLATFTLLADQDLLIDNLLEYSDPNNTPPVYFAVHFQGTSNEAAPGYDSETVGGGNPSSVPERSVPEPAIMLLVGGWLIGFAAIGRKKFSKK
jgi:hypothetical protein